MIITTGRAGIRFCPYVDPPKNRRRATGGGSIVLAYIQAVCASRLGM